MKGLFKKGVFIAGALVSAVILEVSLGTGVFIASSEARVGRPLTPVSVAGVARRTSRRTVRRTTAYVTTLPAGCVTVVVEGVSVHQCGTTYYQAHGSQYVIVNVD
jgi:hypothetical protein